MQVIDSDYVKNLAKEIGADLCGIASVERFDDAPHGFHPRDIQINCRSVIVLCSQFPTDSVDDGPQIYTAVRNAMNEKMRLMAIAMADRIKELGVDASPINPIHAVLSESRYRGTISLKHAAVFAGLGKIGKNTLVVNDKYGNMVWFSAVLTSAELNPDPIAAYDPCPPECNVCVEMCPADALGDPAMEQLKCFYHAFKKKDDDYTIVCWTCRTVCPNFIGMS